MPSQPSDSIFDKQALMQFLFNDREMFEKISNIFLEDIPVKIEKIEHAINNNNPEEIRLIAHSLKGAAGAVRAYKLQNAALQLENAEKNSNLHNSASLLKNIVHKFEQVKQIMKM